MLSIVKNVWVYALVAAIAALVTGYVDRSLDQRAGVAAIRELRCQDALATRRGLEVTGVPLGGDAPVTVLILQASTASSSAQKLAPIIARWNAAKADIERYC